jgi:ABC-2 type transport system permease protein
MQAMQMTFFFFLPSILLSGFMFPFRGMPDWAQGSARRCRSRTSCAWCARVMLKGAGFADIVNDLWPLTLILLVLATLALLRFRRTLD